MSSIKSISRNDKIISDDRVWLCHSLGSKIRGKRVRIHAAHNAQQMPPYYITSPSYVDLLDASLGPWIFTEDHCLLDDASSLA